MKNRLTLVGYMGSGKSTVGRALAEKMGLPFVDLDQEIEKESGTTIYDLITRKGEFYFRKLENKKLMEVLSREKYVLSTGGGAPCYFEAMDEIVRRSFTIYLNPGVKTLVKRLEIQKAKRPLIAHLAHDDLAEFVAKHVFERSRFYERADRVIYGENPLSEILNEHE